MVRTLLDRSDALCTEQEDRDQEVNHIKKALRQCGYPSWTFSKVQTQRSISKTTKRKPEKSTSSTRGMVCLPYVAGLSESFARIFRKHGVHTAMRPAGTLRQALVKPKDKLDTMDIPNCVYRIPCMSCPKAYVGESGRKLGVRIKEHQKEVEDTLQVAYTRAQRLASISEVHKSAIADHTAQENHLIDWDSAKILDREEHRPTRWIKEAIRIRQAGDQLLNRDGGNHDLPHLYDAMIREQRPLVASRDQTSV